MRCNKQQWFRVGVVSIVASNLIHIHSWENLWGGGNAISSLVRWRKFHLSTRKAWLIASNMLFGGVGMFKVSRCGKPHWMSVLREWLAWDSWHLHKLVHRGWKASTLICAIRLTYTYLWTIHTILNNYYDNNKLHNKIFLTMKVALPTSKQRFELKVDLFQLNPTKLIQDQRCSEVVKESNPWTIISMI